MPDGPAEADRPSGTTTWAVVVAGGSGARFGGYKQFMLLAGREVPEPTFNSVCYSMLAPQSAISIHGRFDIQDGRIVAVESPAAPTAAAPTATVSATTTAGAQQAREAQRWYRSIRADSFAG